MQIQSDPFFQIWKIVLFEKIVKEILPDFWDFVIYKYCASIREYTCDKRSFMISKCISDWLIGCPNRKNMIYRGKYTDSDKYGIYHTRHMQVNIFYRLFRMCDWKKSCKKRLFTFNLWLFTLMPVFDFWCLKQTSFN